MIGPPICPKTVISDDSPMIKPIARRLTDAGEQLEKERMRQRQGTSAPSRRHDGDGAFCTDGTRRHVTAKFISMFARQRPELFLFRVADRRMIVERA